MAYKPEQRTDIVNRICQHISENKSSLREALKLEGMPDSVTFYKWIDEDSEKLKQYVRACEERADAIFEDIIEISEDREGRYQDEDGNLRIDSGTVQNKRLEIDTKKWVLSKMNPKKYGDKLDVTSDNKPIQPLEFKIIK